MTEPTLEDLSRAPELVVDAIDVLDRDLADAFEAQATGFAKRAELQHPVNKAPSTVAAASIYLTGLLQEARFTQHEVADAVGVSAVSVRNCYPEIADCEGITLVRKQGTFPTPEVEL